MTRQNAEEFARLIGQALAPAEEPPTPEEQAPGPRKPSPVPEVGATGAPGAAEAARAYEAEQALSRAFNLPHFN
ncbi:hypothetical protein [Corynebacterium nuruki]|uniref:hypothetical protein n=1 Tax=Corynebacterium nuruki TaxID=1032851 RepID=UPI0039BF2430